MSAGQASCGTSDRLAATATTWPIWAKTTPATTTISMEVNSSELKLLQRRAASGCKWCCCCFHLSFRVYLLLLAFPLLLLPYFLTLILPLLLSQTCPTWPTSNHCYCSSTATTTTTTTTNMNHRRPFSSSSWSLVCAKLTTDTTLESTPIIWWKTNLQ